MDEIVQKAMAKWPDVPHCYGWLALDARGQWRMRDDTVQRLGLAGDKITQSKLLGFIHRNYAADSQGRWYFQNGPQRVYVNLAATPHIVRTDGTGGFVLHNDVAVALVHSAWMSESGSVLLDCDGLIAQLDDRDLASCLACLQDGASGNPVSDLQLMDWCDGGAGQLDLRCGERLVRVEHIDAQTIPARFGFVAIPQPDLAV